MMRSAVLDSPKLRIVVATLTNLVVSTFGKNILDKYFIEKTQASESIEGFTLSSKFCFDTVIIDDAQMVDECEVIQSALRYQCRRLILIGSSSVGKTDFRLAEVDEPLDKIKVAERKRYKLQETQHLYGRVRSLLSSGVTNRIITLNQGEMVKSEGKKIIFVDVSEGKENIVNSKFTNNTECDAVIDYFVTSIQTN
mmetsp:Transcript_6777/g.11387  ORF Transcript_6777/g.11387 Transcript_6777/m.11387 type:complete len:196 (-) Transcript_6777:532-1119(-)